LHPVFVIALDIRLRGVSIHVLPALLPAVRAVLVLVALILVLFVLLVLVGHWIPPHFGSVTAFLLIAALQPPFPTQMNFVLSPRPRVARRYGEVAGAGISSPRRLRAAPRGDLAVGAGYRFA
jgi:hypothetical protein